MRRGPMRLRALRDSVAETQAFCRLDPWLRDFRRRGDRPSPGELGEGLDHYPARCVGALRLGMLWDWLRKLLSFNNLDEARYFSGQAAGLLHLLAVVDSTMPTASR